MNTMGILNPPRTREEAEAKFHHMPSKMVEDGQFVAGYDITFFMHGLRMVLQGHSRSILRYAYYSRVA